MKKVIFSLIVVFAIFAIIISTVPVAFANLQVIKSFNATVNLDAVNINWETSSETNVVRFEVQRKSSSDFKTIHTQAAKGQSSLYKYTDSDSFTKESSLDSPQSSNVATYRIIIVYSNSKTSQTEEITVHRSVNSIKRTLGMLKEMFK